MARHLEQRILVSSKKKIDDHVIEAERDDDDQKEIYDIQDTAYRLLVLAL